MAWARLLLFARSDAYLYVCKQKYIWYSNYETINSYPQQNGVYPMSEKVTKSKRNGQYELIRVAAMFFVIGVHLVETLPVDTPRRILYNSVFSLTFYTCNGLFFMLSGKFALGGTYKSKEDRKRYFQKRILNLILPMIFFMWLRSAYSVRGDIFHLEFWNLCLRNILCDYMGKDYWFLYLLLGNLLIAPFLSKAFTKADKGELQFFVGVGILYSALCVYLPYVGFSMEWKYLFAEWTFYFCLGYCLEQIVESTMWLQPTFLLHVGCGSF
jgi:surface polysaccharide O-acyltransferase-like enzyme